MHGYFMVFGTVQVALALPIVHPARTQESLLNFGPRASSRFHWTLFNCLMKDAVKPINSIMHSYLIPLQTPVITSNLGLEASSFGGPPIIEYST
jgi:hypothetical protein